MNKEKRKDYIKRRRKEIVYQRELLRREKSEIDLELDYMKGIYDLSWEEKYQ